MSVLGLRVAYSGGRTAAWEWGGVFERIILGPVSTGCSIHLPRVLVFLFFSPPSHSPTQRWPCPTSHSTNRFRTHFFPFLAMSWVCVCVRICVNVTHSAKFTATVESCFLMWKATMWEGLCVHGGMVVWVLLEGCCWFHLLCVSHKAKQLEKKKKYIQREHRKRWYWWLGKEVIHYFYLFVSAFASQES